MRPTAEVIRQAFDYERETGLIRFRTGGRGKIRGGGRGPLPGDVAGCPIRDGWRIKFKSVEYPAAVIAFVIVEGRWPAADVDHQDRDRMNNRWANLREATRSQNLANTGTFPHSAPYKGVSFDQQTGKWRARIGVNGRLLHLGRFADLEAAHSAYLDAARKYFGEFARG